MLELTTQVLSRRFVLLCYFALFFLLTSPIFAQSDVARNDMKGIIRDAKSGEALPYANVSIEGTKIGTSTNTDGYFVLVNVPVGTYTLIIHYIGYTSKYYVVQNKPLESPLLKIDLEPTVLEMEGVTVTANAEMLKTTENISQISLSPMQLSSLPSIGEVDVFRSMQLLPGVSAANDGSSGLYVRGGTPDQNLILFDGMTIYHVDHFFGFFSAFNADAIKDIQLYKGGFSAEYGGRISSVVDLTGKTGDQNKTRFGFGANLLSAHASLELPISDKGAFLLAGRRSYTDFIRSPLYDSIYELMTGEEDGGAVGGNFRPQGGGGRMGGNQMTGEYKPSFYFYDLNSKLTLLPTSKDIFTFSLYSGKDNLDKSQDFGSTSFRFGDTGTTGTMSTTDFTKWGNVGMSGKWSRQWHDRFHVDILAAYSRYFSDYDRSTDTSGNTFAQNDSLNMRRSFLNATKEENTVKDMSYKIDMDWQATQSNRMDFGLHVSNFDNEYYATRDDSTDILTQDKSALLYTLYAQDKLKIKNLELTMGLRGSHYDRTDKLYYEPRVSFSYPVMKNLCFKGAWGEYYQFVNQINNEDITQGARDFWLLADENFKPSYAEHNIVGLTYENRNYVFGIEGYYKNLDNILEFSRRFISRRQTEDNFFIGSGVSKGLEFLVQKKRGMLTGWIGYTLGKVDYTFPEINNGIEFSAEQDRRHEINVVTKLTRGVYTLSASFVFASGNAYTSPESQYFIPLLDGQTYSYIHVSDKNANRLPDYHRLDLSASRRFESEKWAMDLGISVFNVYNHTNVWYRDYNLDTVPITISDVLMLGFTPTIYFQMNLK